MKTLRYLLIAALALGCAVSGWAEKKAQKNILFQYSTFSALGAGVFDGDLTVGKFKEHGDFGIGTFNYLDGEMVLLDGKMYRIVEGGKPVKADPKMNIPFGIVAAFESDRTQAIGKEMGQDDLKRFFDGLLPSKNVFYALRVSGEFPYLKMRTLSKQNRPYPKLLDVYKSQDVFEGKDVKGTLVGFWIPNYATGINATDYHFHFISDDRKLGGHVLDLRISHGQAMIDMLPTFHLVLPENQDFLTTDLSD
jgi:acetolactate decarboxylase